MAEITVGMRVAFVTRQYRNSQDYEGTEYNEVGTVKRVWGTRAQNVTVVTDDGATFVRLAHCVWQVSS